ncbi:hypothetical protein [Bradyrhizobium sp. C9]|uniref:hypothetical protein n=1 Tax=Bradyrhizobium sp. C9 TaxID=142585 RepID=UPI001FE1A219|nr:hypothetical protein [Bradyrhizobium sp. C9]
MLHPSRRSYLTYLKLIENEFGDLPLAALADRRVRGDFKNWRGSFAETPRKADYAWTTLARIMSFTKNRGIIATNPRERRRPLCGRAKGQYLGRATDCGHARDRQC